MASPAPKHLDFVGFDLDEAEGDRQKRPRSFNRGQQKSDTESKQAM